ncbi:MAG TPA: ParA family protein [Thiotrichales bacterium]|nr:ParA family protein [Thiotrichales bacterium]
MISWTGDSVRGTATLQRQRSRVWAVANQKGGVGKTTTVSTLAGELVGRGRRVLMVDLDPHGSLTAWFGRDPDAQGPSVYGLFQAARAGERPDGRRQLIATDIEGLDLMPASTAQATLDRQVAGIEGMGLVLGQALAPLQATHDVILLDCPPMLGVLMVNALAACDRLIIPVQTEFLAIKGLERMLRTLAMIRRSRGEVVDHLIVPTLYDQRTRASRDTLAMLRERWPEALWDDRIPVDTRFRDASRRGLPLSLWQPQSRGAQAYARLADALLETAAGAEADERRAAV